MLLPSTCMAGSQKDSQETLSRARSHDLHDFNKQPLALNVQQKLLEHLKPEEQHMSQTGRMDSRIKGEAPTVACTGLEASR